MAQQEMVMMARRLPRVVCAGSMIALALAAGCSSSVNQNSGTAGHGENLAAAVHALGQCVRAHGLPGFADPTVVDGQVHIPSSAPRLPASAERACRSIIDRLPDPGPTNGPPVPQRTFGQWLSFARCMRAHGLPDFPDPNPDGSFTLPSDIVHLPNGAIRSQMEVCRSLSPGGFGKFQGQEAS